MLYLTLSFAKKKIRVLGFTQIGWAVRKFFVNVFAGLLPNRSRLFRQEIFAQLFASAGQVKQVKGRDKRQNLAGLLVYEYSCERDENRSPHALFLQVISRKMTLTLKLRRCSVM